MIGESKGTDQHFNREYSKNIPFTIDTLRRIACFVVFWKADFVKKNYQRQAGEKDYLFVTKSLGEYS